MSNDAIADTERPSLTLTRTFRAPPERVWRAWTEPDAVAAWFGPFEGTADAQLDVRVGGAFRIAFEGPGGETHTALGTYEVVEPHQRLAFTWSWISTPERQSFVTLTLQAVADGTEFRLHHTRFADTTARDNHNRGWSAALDKLDRHLDGAWVA